MYIIGYSDKRQTIIANQDKKLEEILSCRLRSMSIIAHF